MEPLRKGDVLTRDVLALEDGQERITYVELRVATEELRDAQHAQQKAAERYQKALAAFNAHVAPPLKAP